MSDDPAKTKILEERDWDILIDRVNKGQCTPIIGPGACEALITEKHEIARTWAKEYDYSFEGASDLARVARFLALTQNDESLPKDELARIYERIVLPSDDRNEPHRVLAELPFPIYITTNYDNFMWQALNRTRRSGGVRLDLCRWNRSIPADTPRAFVKAYEPTTANPVVYHLFGKIDLIQSIVLTDDDYFGFLINVSKDEKLIAPRIQRALANSSVLMLGYKLDDWDFRVLFHVLFNYLASGLKRTHVAVQLVPKRGESIEDQQEKAQIYLNSYLKYLRSYFRFKNLPEIRISVETCRDFVVELRDRWKEAENAR